jgi:Malectin domain
MIISSQCIWKFVSLLALIEFISYSIADNLPIVHNVRSKQNKQRREKKQDIASLPGIRINCGSSLDWIDPITKFKWIADSYYSAGSWTYAGGKCPIAAVRSLSCKHRYFSDGVGGSYNVPVPTQGQYKVRLHFSEIFFKRPNQRVFDVYVQDTAVVSNLDLFSVAGRNTRYNITTTVTVNDNLIVEINLKRKIQNPIISGIEIIPISNTPISPTTTPISNTPKSPTTTPFSNTPKSPTTTPTSAPVGATASSPAPVSKPTQSNATSKDSTCTVPRVSQARATFNECFLLPC